MPRTIRWSASAVVVAVLAASLPIVFPGSASAARIKTVKVADASVIEGDAGTKTLSFKLTWSGSKGGGGVSVSYATADGSAIAGSDYTAKSGTVGLSNGGCRCGTVSVIVAGDVVFEGTETFSLNLSNPVNGVIGDAQAIGTIYDNEGPPTLIAADASVDENAGAATVTVVLTSTVAGGVAVDYATADDTATAGTDYTAKSGTLSFSASQTSKTFTVSIANDALAEDDETFLLNLSNASNASITDPQGGVTINDDDADPDATIAAGSVTEGDAGTATLSMTVSLSAAAGREVAVDYTSSDGTATAGTDYTIASGTLTFTAGETSKDVEVPVAGDVVHEGDETLTVTLSDPVNANLGATSSATGTITNDDAVPSVAIGNVAVDEGDSGTSTATFTVAVSGESAFGGSVQWTTVDGTASSGSDFETASGTLSLLAGSDSATINVTIDGDMVDEPNEAFTVQLSTPTDVTISDGVASGTINDDDPTVTALTLKAAKTSKAVKAKGTIESAATGMKIQITLLKKKGAKFMKVTRKTVAVSGTGDRDGDSLPDAVFGASFKRPSHGTYKFIAKYLGGTNFLAASRKIQFKM